VCDILFYLFNYLRH